MYLLIYACIVSAPIVDFITRADLMYRSDSFVSFDEFAEALNPGKLMMRTDLFVNASGTDLVQVLQDQLHTNFRISAVKHFVDNNKFELKQALLKMFKATTESKFILLKARVNTNLLKDATRPLQEVLTKYINDRPGRPLYDYLPPSARDPLVYDAIFSIVDKASYRVIRGDVGLIAVLPDEQRERDFFCLPSFLKSKIIFVGSLPQRIIDVENQCAVDLKYRFKRAILFPKHRCLIAKDTESRRMVMWYRDSAEPLRISVPSGMVSYRIRYLAEKSFFEVVMIDEFKRDFDTLEEARKCLRIPIDPADDSGIFEVVETQNEPVEELGLPSLSSRAMGSNSGIGVYGRGFKSVKSFTDLAELDDPSSPRREDSANRTERRRLISSVVNHLHGRDYSSAWREVQAARDRFVERKLQRKNSIDSSNQPVLVRLADAIDRAKSAAEEFWVMFDG